MQRLQHILEWGEKNGDILFDMIRIYLGIGLFIKAIFFVQNKDYLFGLVNQAGDLWFAPAAIVHYVILAHIGGGVCMAFGLLTRLGALIQIPSLIGAVFYIYLPQMVSMEPRQHLEFTSLVLFLLVLIVIRGPGRFSADSYIAKHKSK